VWAAPRPERRTPACASARRTMWPTAAGLVGPLRGAHMRRKTRRDALPPRSSRMYRARASPTSDNSGKWSTVRPFPWTTISPARQRPSSSSSATTSPPRRPSRASRSRIAWSRRPLNVDPVAASARSTSLGERNAGGTDWRYLRNMGAALERSREVWPHSTRNRRNDRSAVHNRRAHSPDRSVVCSRTMPRILPSYRHRTSAPWGAS